MITLGRLRTILLVAGVCWVVLFWRLGRIGLIDDEAHYARVTQAMSAQGDWLIPRLDGTAFIDKPVFFHWIQGLTTALAPDAELGVRLPSALAAVALFGIAGWLAVVCVGAGAGRGAWLMLATVPATFLLGRTGFMDMLFSALLFGAVALTTRALIATSAWAQAGAVVCLALAILTKGPIAAALVGIWLAGLWLMGGDARRAVSALSVGKCVLGVAVLAAPWFLWAYSQYPDLFVRDYLGGGHVGYLTPRNSASSKQWTFYLRMFMTSFFPWSFIALGYGVDTLRRWRHGARIPLWETGLWLWIAVVLTAFTLVPFRVDRYIYPAAPACCLLALRGWLAASAETRWREFPGTRTAVVIVALALVGAGAFLWSALPRMELPLPAAIVILPGMLMIGGVAIGAAMTRRGRDLPNLAGWPVATLLTVYASLVFVGLPIVRAGLPVEQVGRFVADQASSGAAVGVLGLDRWESGLAYYLRTPPHHLGNAEEAEQFANAPGPRWLVMRKEELKVPANGGCVALSVPAIVGTKGRGIRTQVWGDVVVIRYDTKTSDVSGACPAP